MISGKEFTSQNGITFINGLRFLERRQLQNYLGYASHQGEYEYNLRTRDL